MSASPTIVTVRYNEQSHCGSLSVPKERLETAIWARLKLSVSSKLLDYAISGCEITLAWADTLGVVRELGSKAEQKSLNFRFRARGQSRGTITRVRAADTRRSEAASQVRRTALG